jgi:hypothetical protein
MKSGDLVGLARSVVTGSPLGASLGGYDAFRGLTATTYPPPKTMPHAKAHETPV